MTGYKYYIEDISPSSPSLVTFGDGGKGKIKGVGKLTCSKLPNLDQVLYVKGLTTSLISIIQL